MPPASSQNIAAPEHVLALRESGADAVRRILPARLIGIEESDLQFGPETSADVIPAASSRQGLSSAARRQGAAGYNHAA